MKKKEFAVAVALLSASSALCLRIMKKVDEKLRRENIRGKEKANQTHYEVGRKVRQTIAELGGTMPEDLPTPEKSIRQIESEQKRRIKG